MTHGWVPAISGSPQASEPLPGIPKHRPPLSCCQCGTHLPARAGTPVSGGAGIESLGGSLLSFLPQGNVTFLATYSKLSPFNPVVQNVIYFTELAISNAAGVTVESTIINPALAANGQGIDLNTAVIFRDLDLAQQFQQQLNQQPQNVFGASPILRVRRWAAAALLQA